MKLFSTRTIGIFLIALIAFWWVWYTEQVLAPDTSTPLGGSEEEMFGLTVSADASDAGLEQDLTAIDAELKGLENDRGDIDESISDTQLPQETL